VSSIYAGIDVGTTTTKAVVINANREILGSSVRRSGANLVSAATEAFEESLAQAKLNRDIVQTIVATGYGRRNVSFAHDARTEISCHGLGCHYYFPKAITIVDIGGQDNKIIKLDAQGKPLVGLPEDSPLRRQLVSLIGQVLPVAMPV